jgi:23S rRNA pseudouridine1911/1915/1917 synthase
VAAQAPDGRGSRKSDGEFLDAHVRTLLGAPWNRARGLIRTGRVLVNGVRVRDERHRVHASDTVSVEETGPKRTGTSLAEEDFVYEDAHVVVVRKPPGISTVPFEEGDHGTLDELTRNALVKRSGERGRPALGVVHRIDKETSGLVVFTRTWLAKESLTQQFRSHTVSRRYLAIVHGSLAGTTFRSRLIADRGDGLRGSLEWREARGLPTGGQGGQASTTHVEPLATTGVLTLLRCRLETGRTHQIRVHLSEAGHPLLGERVYVRDYRGTLLPAPRLMLHAAQLGFVHPATGEQMLWEEPPPMDMRRLLDEHGLSASL